MGELVAAGWSNQVGSDFAASLKFPRTDMRKAPSPRCLKESVNSAGDTAETPEVGKVTAGSCHIQGREGTRGPRVR